MSYCADNGHRIQMTQGIIMGRCQICDEPITNALFFGDYPAWAEKQKEKTKPRSRAS